MNFRTTTLSIFSVIFVGASFMGCDFFKKKEADFSQDLIRPLPSNQVILEYNGGQVKVADVQEAMDPQFQRIREQLLGAYVRAAEEVLSSRMADRLGSTVEEVSNVELENYMKANKIPSDQKDKIRVFLTGEKNRIQGQLARQQMMKDLNVVNKLGAARYDLSATSSMPSQGPAGAKVTIQVFCDFGNPLCNRSRLVMAQLRTQFGDRVRWIYRHFPVASNQIGFAASRHAFCAQEQDLFWPVHDLFYDQQSVLTTENLREIALSAKLNVDKFDSCLRSENTEKKLQAEIKAAEALGLTQTPVFFVNGARINDLEQLMAYVAGQVEK